MVVHDRSYARWDGDREAPVRAIRVILERGVTSGVSALFRRRIFALLLSFVAYGPFLFGLGVMYVAFWAAANIEEFPEFGQQMLASPIIAFVTPNPDTIWGYLFEIQRGVTLILCVIVGSGLIAEDRRTNALELYLSRPVSVGQYLLGKLAIMGFFLAMVTVVPAIILIVVQMFLGGFETEQVGGLLDLLWRTVVAGGLGILVLSLLVLAASSLTRRARNAGILWVAFLFVIDLVVANLLREAFREPAYNLASLSFNLGQCMAWVLGNAAEIDAQVPVVHAALVLAGWCLAALVIILRRVRPVEIVA